MAHISRSKQRSNIRKALSRVRRSQRGGTAASGKAGRRQRRRATFRDISGRLVSIPIGSGGVNVTVAVHNARVLNTERKKIRKEQKAIARKKIGSIRAVRTRGNQITFIGATGKSFTFPRGRLTFSGQEKFGGIETKESLQLRRTLRQETSRSQARQKITASLLKRQIQLKAKQIQITKQKVMPKNF